MYGSELTSKRKSKGSKQGCEKLHKTSTEYSLRHITNNRIFVRYLCREYTNTSMTRSVTRQNGIGHNGTDKMVWTKWYTDKMVLDKMVWTKWYGQNGTISYLVYILIKLNSIYIL